MEVRNFCMKYAITCNVDILLHAMANLPLSSYIYSLCALSRGGFVAGYCFGTMIVWRPSSPSHPHQFCAEEAIRCHEDCVKCIQQMADETLVSCSFDKCIKITDINSDPLKQTSTQVHDNYVDCICVFPEGNRVASGGDDCTLCVTKICK